MLCFSRKSSKRQPKQRRRRSGSGRATLRTVHRQLLFSTGAELTPRPQEGEQDRLLACMDTVPGQIWVHQACLLSWGKVRALDTTLPPPAGFPHIWKESAKHWVHNSRSRLERTCSDEDGDMHQERSVTADWIRFLLLTDMPRFRDAEDALNQANSISAGIATEELVTCLPTQMGLGSGLIAWSFARKVNFLEMNLPKKKKTYQLTCPFGVSGGCCLQPPCARLGVYDPELGKAASGSFCRLCRCDLGLGTGFGRAVPDCSRPVGEGETEFLCFAFAIHPPRLGLDVSGTAARLPPAFQPLGQGCLNGSVVDRLPFCMSDRYKRRTSMKAISTKLGLDWAMHSAELECSWTRTDRTPHLEYVC